MADLDHRGDVLRRQGEARRRGGGASAEQRTSSGRLYLRDLDYGRNVEWRQPVHVLVGHSQHFLAGDKEANVGGLGNCGIDECRDALEDLLAVVQDEQQTSFGDHRKDGLRGATAVADLHAERMRHGRRHERVVGNGRELDPADAAGKLVARGSGDSLREACLADPARAGDGDRPVRREQGLDAEHVVVATVERTVLFRHIRR